MTHYVCLGECGGVSEHPGICTAEPCSHHGKPLEPCECQDAEHKQQEDEE
ncbi:MAG: hypothetical protein Q8Q38_01165 [bacterium]|nr:hypothetical protein [bacterium]